MRTTIIFLAAVIIVLSFSCNNGNDTAESKADSAANAPLGDMPGTTAASTPPDRTEINDFGSLVPDSVQLRYRVHIDTIYGYRNGQVLYTEGDIKIKIPDQGSRGVGSLNSLWPVINRNTAGNRIVIPFAISSSFDPATNVSIRSALKWWSDSVKIDFVERRLQADYIEFVPSQWTQSYVGMTRGRQTVELADWAKTGNIAHELGHVLGLHHEQARFDRDRHVVINCPLDANYRHAFRQDPYAKDFFQYSFYSIMHYGPSSCLVIPDSTKNKLPPGVPGQRQKIASVDYATIRSMYRLR